MCSHTQVCVLKENRAAQALSPKPCHDLSNGVEDLHTIPGEIQSRGYGDRLREQQISEKNEVTRDKFAQIDYDFTDILLETMVLRDKAAEASSAERVRQQRQTTENPAAWWN